jgi:hypothetical protein
MPRDRRSISRKVSNVFFVQSEFGGRAGAADFGSEQAQQRSPGCGDVCPLPGTSPDGTANAIAREKLRRVI